jgi:septal ring factor EnvC (AmiA/AmiB activator)
VTLRCWHSIALFVVLIVAGGMASAARTAGDATQELRDLRARLQALQKRLAAAEESQGEAADALKGSERAISEANRTLRELGERSGELNRRTAELDAEARTIQAALATQQGLLAQLLYQQYLGAQVNALRLALSGEDPNRIARHLYYLGYVTRARVGLIGDIQQKLARVDQIARETGQRARELTALAREQNEQRQRLEAEKRGRAQVLARISQDIQRQRREIGTLRRNESRLTLLIEQLGRIIARPRAPAPRMRNERVPERSMRGGAFEELKGRLALPVRGELGNRFGSPRPDGGPSWKGVFIVARPGEEVRAVASGRVVFADWLRGFGNMLILDHGGAYMSLYGNNETLYGRVGDEIQAGAAIATVGNSGGNADSGLYFELRHQGRPLDPLSWVAK